MMGILALDTEGTGPITRFSLCDGEKSLSAPWSVQALHLVDRVVKDYEMIAGHNIIGHDYWLLKESGVDLPLPKIFDTMVAAQNLQPHHRAGLGWSAPLYAPLEPFKHLGKARSKEEYALRDAANTWAMARGQIDLLDEYHMEELFFEIEQPFWWLLAELRRNGVYTEGPDGGPFKVRPRYSLKSVGKGYYSVVTGEVEARNPPLRVLDGSRNRRGAVRLLPAPGQRLYTCRIRDPLLQVFRHLTGERLEYGSLEPPVAHAIARGRGPRQFQRDIGLKWGDKKAKDAIEHFERNNPAWWGLGKVLGAQIQSEGFISNPFGRRVGVKTVGEALAFLFDSTEMDLIKEYSKLVSRAVVAVEGRALVLSIPKGKTDSAVWARSFTSLSEIEAEVAVEPHPNETPTHK